MSSNSYAQLVVGWLAGQVRLYNPTFGRPIELRLYSGPSVATKTNIFKESYVKIMLYSCNILPKKYLLYELKIFTISMVADSLGRNHFIFLF